MVKLRDRVKAVSETTGTGAFDVSITPDGFKPFVGTYVEGETFPYAIHHVGEGEWEVGRGELSSAGELVRLEVQDSSAGGSKVDFSLGVKEVFVTATAEFLNKKADKSELFSGSYDDLTNKPSSDIQLGVTAHSWGDHSVAGYAKTKADVGLGNVDNTADEDKPVSTAVQTELDKKADKSELFSGSYDDLTNKPSIPSASDVAKGVTAHSWGDHSVAGYAKTKADVGLGNVDNTSDENKPISTATQAALDDKVDKVSGKALSTNDFTDTLKDKLDGIATGATKNATDAQLRDRATHTGVQPISSVSGLQTALDGKVDDTDSRLTNSREWTASTVSQAEAEAGTATTRRAWTAQRVRQAITAWFNGVSTSFTRTLLGRSNASQVRSDLGLGSAATSDVTTSNADVTSGRLLKVGDLGSNRRPSAVVDFNDLPDLYPYSGAVPVMSDMGSTNGPPKGTYFYVEHHFYSSSLNNVTQIAIPYRVDHEGLWVRSRFNNNWTPWREIYHTGNILKSTGNNDDYPMSQKAVTDALNTKNTQGTGSSQTRTNSQLDARYVQGQAGTGGSNFRTNSQNDSRFIQGGSVVQGTGSSTTNVMSQKAVTDLFVQLAGAEALTKADRMSPCFTKVGAQALNIKAGTSVLVDGSLIHFKSDTPVTLPSLTAGEDYAVFVSPDGTVQAVADPFSSPASPPQPGSRKIGGFHYGLTPPNATVSSGGFATSGPGMHWTQADVNRIRGINEFSIWDVRFRSAGEQHGFAFDPQARVWVAIYFCGPDHITQGISRYNSAVASETVPPKIPLVYGGDGSAVYQLWGEIPSGWLGVGSWWNFMEVAHSHGARMLWEREFNSAAFGTTEQQALGGSSVTIPATKREPGFTSRIGLEQASGHHYTWGMDSNFRQSSSSSFNWTSAVGGRGLINNQGESGIVRVRLGGQRAGDQQRSGSRTAIWINSPWGGHWYCGLRAACDPLIL